MELKSIRRRKLRKVWQRRPAGVLTLSKPTKKRIRRKVLSDEERFIKAFKRVRSEDAEAMRLLAKM